jgi:hypothetical protein
MARYAKFFSLGGGGGTNNLQLPVGTILDTTLRQVQDGTGTGSPLYLSTTGLRVGTTAGSAMYWDNVNNSLGIGTNIPVGVLHLKTAAQNTRLAIDGDAGFNRLISYRTAGLQRFGLYVNNTAESGSNAGSDFAIRAYSDAGTLLNTPIFIKRSTGNVGINTVTGTAKLQVVGSGSTGATTSLLVQNSAGTAALTILDDRTANFSSQVQIQSTIFADSGQIFRSSGNLALQSVAGVGNNKSVVINASPNITEADVAILVCNSTTKGFLPPRVTTIQKNAISGPVAGLMVYDTDLARPCFFNGATWITL